MTDYKDEFKKSKLSEDDKLLIYGIYARLIEGIKHFDGIQTTYRVVSSTLLLAIIGAIGFLFSRMITELPINKLIGVMAICFSGIAGITALGFLDLIFQERLVVANFIEALKLEKKYHWLPRVHHNMIHGGTHHGSPARKSLYYVGCSASLIIIATLACANLFKKNSPSIVLIYLSGCVLISAYAIFFIKKTGNFSRLIERFIKIEEDDDR